MLDVDLNALMTALCHINSWYAVAAAAAIFAVRKGWISLPNIPGVYVKDDALAARLKVRAAAKYAEMLKAGADPDEAHAAVVKAIKEVK